MSDAPPSGPAPPTGTPASGRTGVDDSSARGLGRVAVVVALVSLAAIGIGAVLAVLASVLGDDETPALDLAVGDCVVLDLPVSGDLRSVPVVPCDGSHTAEVFAVGELDPDGDREYPPDDQTLLEVMVGVCLRSPGAGRPSAFEAYVGVPFERSELGFLPIAPDRASWGPTNGRYVCLVEHPVADPVAGSLRGSRR